MLLKPLLCSFCRQCVSAPLSVDAVAGAASLGCVHGLCALAVCLGCVLGLRALVFPDIVSGPP